MSGKAPKRPRDMNQLAKLVSELATGQTTEVEARSAAAAILGRKGGLKFRVFMRAVQFLDNPF